MPTFDELWAQYGPVIRSTVDRIRKGHDSLERDDAMQEARIILLRCIEQFEPQRDITFGAYLKGALSNSLLAWAQKTLPHKWETVNGRGVRRFVKTTSLDEIPEDSISISGVLVEEYDHLKHVRDVLARRINQLTDKQFIKLTEYAGVLLEDEAEIKFYHERELLELKHPYRPEEKQTQPRLSDTPKNSEVRRGCEAKKVKKYRAELCAEPVGEA